MSLQDLSPVGPDVLRNFWIRNFFNVWPTSLTTYLIIIVILLCLIFISHFSRSLWSIIPLKFTYFTYGNFWRQVILLFSYTRKDFQPKVYCTKLQMDPNYVQYPYLRFMDYDVRFHIIWTSMWVHLSQIYESI